MPSYRERREAGEFESGKSVMKAVEEAAADEEAGDETPAEKPKKSGVKVTDSE